MRLFVVKINPFDLKNHSVHSSLKDASGKFLQEGYKKAVAAKAGNKDKDKPKPHQQQFGAKGPRDRVGPQQEKNIWLTLVDHLSRKDKLPVVAFTLSRNR